MHSEALLDMRRRCRLPAESFGIAGRVMRNFHKAQLDAASLLAGRKASLGIVIALYALGSAGVPHFDIQWRFVDWRYCPDHNCLMEDVCWRCRAPVTFPVDMAQSRYAGRKGLRLARTMHVMRGRFVRSDSVPDRSVVPRR